MEFELESTKIDRISQQKRLLCYAYYFKKLENNNEDDALAELKQLIDSTDNWKSCYETYFENPAVNDTDEVITFASYVLHIEDANTNSMVKDIWTKVKNVIQKESDCEKRIYDILTKAAREHPVISKIIVAALMSILIGLVEDCIHDGIQGNYKSKETQSVNIYISEDGDKYTEISIKDNQIFFTEK